MKGLIIIAKKHVVCQNNILLIRYYIFRTYNLHLFDSALQTLNIMFLCFLGKQYYMHNSYISVRHKLINTNFF